MKRYETYIFLIFLILIPNLSNGQREKYISDIKNNQIKDDNKFVLNDDTIKEDLILQSEQFYDTLKLKASKNKYTRAALDLILIQEPDKGLFIGEENIRRERYFKLYEGKKIRNIEIIKLDVFGPGLNDSISKATNWIQKAGNKTHVKTRDFIIKNNLLVSKGDTIDATLLVDNERLFRELDYIKDAIIQIAEVKGQENFVDVLIIIKDVYSAGFYVDLWNINSGSVEIYENNLAGIGHKIQGRWLIDTDKSPTTGYQFSYKINNLGNTFIQSQIQYYKAFNSEKFDLIINRPFFTYNTKWAGHLKVFQTSTLRDIKKTDTTLTDVRLNYATQDLWISRSFLLKNKNINYANRTRFVIGARYINNNFYKGPEVREKYNFNYRDNQIFLASLAFARQRFYTSNLLYGFGKTEDIPIGTLIQINGGLEKDDFLNRPYLGLILAKGIYNKKIGYLSFKSELGGLYCEDKIEQGVFKLNAKVISNIHYFKHLKLREFLSINYTRGINRFSDESVYFNSANDIWGFSSDKLFGSKKLSFNSELVAFTNLYLYNFRFVFFGFGDIGFIGPENKSIFRNQLYSGVGLGVRVRNENLVFKTFQIKFAFYPTVPSDMNQFYLLVSGESYLKPFYYEPKAPAAIDFR